MVYAARTKQLHSLSMGAGPLLLHSSQGLVPQVCTSLPFPVIPCTVVASFSPSHPTSLWYLTSFPPGLFISSHFLFVPVSLPSCFWLPHTPSDLCCTCSCHPDQVSTRGKQRRVSSWHSRHCSALTLGSGKLGAAAIRNVCGTPRILCVFILYSYSPLVICRFRSSYSTEEGRMFFDCCC